MPEERRSHRTAPRELIDLLAEHLLASKGLPWPGVDGLTTADFVAVAYPAELAAGRVPPFEDLIALYPAYAEAIRAMASGLADPT
jgi:hypothetical protein